jgi:SAM-dependent methyltransferase
VSEYYETLQRAFDHAAPTYDDLAAVNAVMAWMRRESLAMLAAALPADGLILEIGCGTGEEALALAQRGYRVVATDISPAMIEAARAKDVGGRVSWHVLPAGQLGDPPRSFEKATFDGAYASFGAMNCEPRVDQVAAAVAGLLRPGASFICSVMNRWCAWEIAWGLFHLKPVLAFRRLRKGWIPARLAVPEGTVAVPVRYYSPREFARACSLHFRVRSVRGLPVLLPPPYLAPLVTHHPWLLGRLEGPERRWRECQPLSALGDHFMMVLERTGS